MTHLNLVDSAELHPKYLSAELQMFSQDVSALVECFTQFPEFIDEIHDQSFKNELKVNDLRRHTLSSSKSCLELGYVLGRIRR